MTLAIETARLTRYFDDFCAVDGIDLRVERGTFYGFLGPNGAGKSTTIKMLTGLLAPSDGRDPRPRARTCSTRSEALEAKSRVGVIPEDLALFDNLTAREYLTFVGRMYLLPRDTIRSRIDELLPLLGLAGRGEEADAGILARHEEEAGPGRGAAAQPGPAVPRRAVRGGGRGHLARHPRPAGRASSPAARRCS